jgi:transcriptional regulator
MSSARIELPQGALELLVLRTLARQSKHGYAIVKSIRERSEEELQVEEGSLYPALHRMERHGWIAAEWGVSDSGRRAKFYALTDDGRKRLSAARKSWLRMTRAIGLVLGGKAAEA